MSLVWINGRLIEKVEAKVSPFDHGFLYGDGVWEPLRLFNGRLLLLAEHITSLFDSAKTLGIDIPLTRDELAAAIEGTVRANNRTEGYIRVIVSRGPGTLGPDPRKIEPQVVIIAEEYHPFPLDLYAHGLHASTFAAPRHGARWLGQPHIVRAKQHAIQNGCLEAILMSTEGELFGATEGMLFLVKDGALVVAGGQIAEATGYAIAATAGEAGLAVVEYVVKRDELFASEETFIAGTSCGVIGLVRVDNRDIGSGTEGPITHQLREGFLTLSRGSG